MFTRKWIAIFGCLTALLLWGPTSYAATEFKCTTLVEGSTYNCRLTGVTPVITSWALSKPNRATLSTTGPTSRNVTCTDFEPSYNETTREWVPYTKTVGITVRYNIVPNFPLNASRTVNNLKCDSKPAPGDVPAPMVAQAPNVSVSFMYCGEPNGTAHWNLLMSPVQGTAEDYFIERSWDSGASWTQIYDGANAQIECPGDSLKLRIRVLTTIGIVPSKYRYLTLFRNCPSGDPGEDPLQ